MDELVVDPKGDIVKKRRVVFVEITDPGRTDALRLDKKCGKSGIAASKKCSKKTSPSTITKVALGAGAVAGVAGLALLARRRWGRRDPNWKGFSAPGEDWDRIEREARQGGKKWDVFEKNKKANAVACAATKVDSWIREDRFIKMPRCYGGEGAFGNYVIHPSKAYGIKYLHNQGLAPNEEFRKLGLSLKSEGEMLHYANINGVAVPKLYKANDKVIVMEHLDGYKSLMDLDLHSPYDNRDLRQSAPFAVKKGLLGAFSTLHKAGIVHNDLHMNNVVFNAKTGDVRMLDLGLAEFAQDRPRDFISEVFGTPQVIGMSDKASMKFVDRWSPMSVNMELALADKDTDLTKRLVTGYYKSLEIAFYKDSAVTIPKRTKRQP